jgi:hypothetical protein
VQWTVRIEEGFASTYDQDNNGLEYGNSGLLSNYTGEMRTILRDYTRSHALASDTYYLFITPRADDNSVTGYMPRKKQAGFIFTDKISNNPAKIIAHELAHGAFRLEHSFPELPENGNNLMDYSLSGTTLHKHQWDLIHDPVAVLGIFDGDEDAAYSWNGTLVDAQHTELFDHVYANNHIGELKYLSEIDRVLSEDPAKQTLDLNYDNGNEYKAWINSWKIRVVNSETALNNTIKVIQDTKAGDKMGSMYLKPNHIYIAKYKYNDQEYPIAIYRAGEVSESDQINGVFTKVEVTDKDDLDKEKNKKHIYVEETFFSYFIIAFYKNGKTKPTLMIQVEKFPFSDWRHNSMAEWLKFLRILVPEFKGESDNKSDLSPAVMRAQLAREKDLDDNRLYKTPIYVPEKLTDEFVDCAEFTNEITLSQGYDIGYGSDGQLEWFKNNGQHGKTWEDVKVGDIIFWDRNYRECSNKEKEKGICICEKKSKKKFYKDVSSPSDIDHVGILVEFDKVSKKGRVVHASVNGGDKPSINEINIHSNGNTYDGTCDQMTFVAWGRIEKD